MNHEYIAHKETKGEFTLKIIADNDPMSPRDGDMFGTMATWHRRYNFGEDPDVSNISDPNRWLRELVCNAVGVQIDPDDMKDEHITAILRKHFIILPLALLDHSGLSMWVGDGEHWSDPGGWDSGQVGWIYVTVKDALENWSCKTLDDPVHYPHNNTTKTCKERAIELLKGEVQEYDDFLRGNCYGYTIENGDGEQVDACWGFLGDYDGYILQEAREILNRFYLETPEQRELPFAEGDLCFT